MNVIEYPDDCRALQAMLMQWQIEATLAEVQAFWRWHSEQRSASWLIVYTTESGHHEVARSFRAYVEAVPGVLTPGDVNPFYRFPA